jgi:hypothetical protein
MLKPDSKSSSKTPSKALKKSAKSPEELTKEAAQVAVQEAEGMIEEVTQARTEWSETFPEANLALEDVRHLEDATGEAIMRAKPLVAATGTTISGFKCQRRFSKPRHDATKVLEVFVAAFEGAKNEEEEANIAAAFMLLAQRGMIKDLKLDTDVARVILAQQPDLTNFLAEAWVDKTELTPSVSVPKF